MKKGHSISLNDLLFSFDLLNTFFALRVGFIEHLGLFQSIRVSITVYFRCDTENELFYDYFAKGFKS